MYRFIFYIFLLFMCDRCKGVIHYLNETEYEKLPSLFELENYELCLENPGAIYCVANIELYGDSNNEIYNTILEYSKQIFKHFNYSTIERGVCVTKTCKNYIQKSQVGTIQELTNILEGCLNETMKEKYNLSTRIYRLNCDKSEEKSMEIDVLDYTVAVLFFILLIFIVLGSYYDYKINCKTKGNITEKKHNLLLCFSVFRNTERLTRESNIDERLRELKGLYGIRTMSQILVVFGHSLFTVTGFICDPHNFEKAYDGKLQVIFSATSLVQLFFFMAAFLMTYHLQIYSEKNKIRLKHLPLLFLSRWWKLTAPLAFVLAFLTTWYRHIGTGPLWKYYVTNGVTAQCRDYYWAHIFYFNNLIQEDKYCLVQTWHTAVDIQLFMLGLTVYFLLCNRSWKTKCATLLLLLVIGVISPIYYILKYDLDGIAAYKPEALRTLNDRNFHYYHVFMENNLPCFIMGMGTAYLGYYLKQRQIKLLNFKVGNILCGLSVAVIIGVFYVLSLMFEDPEKSAISFNLILATLHKLVMGLMATIWTLGIVLKFNGLSQALFEWHGFAVLGKLSYGVFLLNVDVYIFLLASRTRLVPVSFLNLFFQFIGVTFVCYVLAFVLYLIVEAPASQLFEVYFEKSQVRKKEE